MAQKNNSLTPRYVREWIPRRGQLLSGSFAFVCALAVSCTDNDSLGDNAMNAGGSSGNTSVSGNAAAGSSGDGLAGDAAGGDSGAAGAGGSAAEAGGNVTCGVPSGDRCPGDLLPYEGREVDTVNACLKKATLLSCSAGANSAESCWVDTASGTKFRLNSGPCIPTPNWRACTPQEFDEVMAVNDACASPQ